MIYIDSDKYLFIYLLGLFKNRHSISKIQIYFKKLSSKIILKTIQLMQYYSVFRMFNVTPLAAWHGVPYHNNTLMQHSKYDIFACF